jgi:fatty-acyl-CoA synthase
MNDASPGQQACLTLSVPMLFERAVAAYGDRVAAAFPDERWTYRELTAAAGDVARRLTAAGIGPAEHVGFLIPNSGRALAVLLGAMFVGAIPVPLNTRYRGDELPHVIEHAELTALVTIGDVAVNRAGETVDYVTRIAAALPAITEAAPGEIDCPAAPRLRTVFAFGDRREPWLVPWPDPAAAPVDRSIPPTVPAASGDTALVLYTSGTTSRPKGVLVGHRALVRSAVAGLVDRVGMSGTDVIWSPAPLCHIGAYMALLAAFAVGATFVSAGHFDPAETAQLLAKENVTIAYAGFPAFYFDLAAELERSGRTLPKWTYLTTAAAPGEIERVRRLLPSVHQLSLTGSTELCGHICLSDPRDTSEQRAETAGRPLDGVEISIRDDAGRPLPDGRTGELWVRGYCLLDGYHNGEHDPLTGDPDPGWFRTGDLGAIVDGRFSFRGRLKDMVKVGGENVAAAEVEAYLLRHPAIALAQVVGVADDRLGEVVAAFVQRAPGAHLEAADVVAYCRGGMAAYKVPRAVRFVTDWPMSATKISKAELRSWLIEPASDPA